MSVLIFITDILALIFCLLVILALIRGAPPKPPRW